MTPPTIDTARDRLMYALEQSFLAGQKFTALHDLHADDPTLVREDMLAAAAEAYARAVEDTEAADDAYAAAHEHDLKISMMQFTAA